MGQNILKVYSYNKPESMDELKNLNPAGYNFIKSLENHENNLVDYINNQGVS